LIRQFNIVIHLFGEFKIFWSKMTYLDEEIRRKLKVRNVKNEFQITKIMKFEIHLKKRKLKFHKLWNFLLVKMKKVHKSKKSTHIDFHQSRLKVVLSRHGLKVESSWSRQKVESSRSGSKVSRIKLGPMIEPS